MFPITNVHANVCKPYLQDLKTTVIQIVLRIMVALSYSLIQTTQVCLSLLGPTRVDVTAQGQRFSYRYSSCLNCFELMSALHGIGNYLNNIWSDYNHVRSIAVVKHRDLVNGGENNNISNCFKRRNYTVYNTSTGIRTGHSINAKYTSHLGVYCVIVYCQKTPISNGSFPFMVPFRVFEYNCY